jgi:hypothetical protein
MNINILLIFLIIVLIIYILFKSFTLIRENLETEAKKDSDALVNALRKTVIDNSVFDTPNDPSDYLVLITATCSGYMDWQSLAAYEKAKKVWPEAQIVRLLHCSLKDRETYKYKEIVPSMYTSDCSCQPRYDDCYPPLNRPVALKEFFDTHTLDDIKQNWIIIMDSDTLLRKRLNYFPVYKGRPVGQFASILMDKMYTAAKPVFKDHDTIIKQPLYDMGSPYILHKEDAKKMAPHWVRITNELRENKETREYIGWIVEMYSYILAAAYVGLDHIVRSDLQSRFPFTDTTEDVASYHYDLEHEKDGHKWCKRDYMKDIIDSDILMKTDDAPNEHIRDILTSINDALLKWRRENKK